MLNRDIRLRAQRKTYTERLRSSLMALISIFRRPMVTVDTQAAMRIKRRQCMNNTRTAMWLAIEGPRRTKAGTSVRVAVTGQRAANALVAG